MATAVYAGTFDPVTNGHLDILRRAAALFDEVVVGVGARIDKRTLLDAETRVRVLAEAVADLANVSAEPFDGLVVDFAERHGASVLVRGVRNSADFDYEQQMAVTNAQLLPGIETVLLVADPAVAFVSSTLVREILKAGGDVTAFVPPVAAVALRAASG
ncbi:MAG: pantetheine-phosphate adenylyltransferase [Planctomycetota bacterium]|jgi:pantetheine-phosphate adenylyltransferase